MKRYIVKTCFQTQQHSEGKAELKSRTTACASTSKENLVPCCSNTLIVIASCNKQVHCKYQTSLTHLRTLLFRFALKFSHQELPHTKEECEPTLQCFSIRKTNTFAQFLYLQGYISLHTRVLHS